MKMYQTIIYVSIIFVNKSTITFFKGRLKRLIKYEEYKCI